MPPKARRCRMASTLDLIPPTDHELDGDLVDTLADSIQKYGLREPVVVVGRHILHGVHRWAAAKKAGIKTLEVVDDVQSLTPEDNAARVIVENLHRQHLSQPEVDRLTIALVKLNMPGNTTESAGISGIQAQNSQPRGPGRPKSPAREAVRRVAKQTGRTEESVRHSVRREEKREVAVDRLDSSMASGRVSNLDEYDNPIPAGVAKKWDTMRATHADIDSLMRRAQGALSKLDALGDDVADYTQHWRELLHTVGHEARSRRPYALCPKCGGKGCDICRNIGFLSETTLARKRYEKVIGA